MAIGIDPMVDFAAKRLLGSPEHSAITIHFLNAVLHYEDPIVGVTILNPISLKDYDADKLSVLDIKAVDGRGRRFNIEVQTSRPPNLPERLTYYAARQLIEQLGEGDDYSDLNPSIGVCVLDAVMFPGGPSPRHAFGLRSAEGLVLTDRLQVHVLELHKYRVPGDDAVVTDPVEQWMDFFRTAAERTPEELAGRLPDPVFGEATGVLEMIARTPEERQRYEDRLKAERDERARKKAAIAEGLEQGLERGVALGQAKLVATLQQLLDEPEQSSDELVALGMDRLLEMEADLKRRLRERG